MIFVDKLVKKIKNKKSHIVIGLDPVIENFPKQFRSNISSLSSIGKKIWEFNKCVIDYTYDIVPAVKPQIAFYERYGIEGWIAFTKTVEYAKKKGLIVIEDAKRNDIGSTAIAYSDGHLGRVKIKDKSVPIFDVDALTVNPYLGSDGIMPFIKDVVKYNKGIFILVKTSNKSSFEFQDVLVNYKNKNIKFYELVAKLVNIWATYCTGDFGYSSVGVVVGATFPKEATKLRKILPKSYFLVPGFGVQGGRAEDMVRFFNPDGFGALISSSRGIIYSNLYDELEKGNKFDIAIRNSTLRMNESINAILSKNNLLHW